MIKKDCVAWVFILGVIAMVVGRETPEKTGSRDKRLGSGVVRVFIDSASLEGDKRVMSLKPICWICEKKIKRNIPPLEIAIRIGCASAKLITLPIDTCKKCTEKIGTTLIKLIRKTRMEPK